MLDTTLTTTFVPGTNLKGSVAGGNWSFLLPSLDLDRIVCFGAPSEATLRTLSRLGREVVVACADPHQIQQLGMLNRRAGLDNIRLSFVDRHSALLIPGASVDLALIAGENGGRRLQRDRALLAEIQRLLKPEGLVYCEFGGPLDRLFGGDPADSVVEGFGARLLFWLTPQSGEMRTAVPLCDQATTGYFLRNSLYSSSANLRVLKRAERFLVKNRLLGRFARRCGALMGQAPAGLDARPPRYLRSIAREAGIDIDRHRWGLAARGQFNSRKVLFFLFEGASESPEYIVKMTRDPALNARLENEERALALLEEKGIGDRETLPRPAFFGHHSGLAILGETIVDGKPFRERTSGTADCPHARAAIDWLVDLGATTADRTTATPLQVVEGLQTLFKRFTRIYQIDPGHYRFLARQIAAIGSSRSGFPLVFQHGDPGTWNILVTREGRVAFLDWEAFEPHGMPLWDLFYFMRAYGAWSARMDGVKNSLKGFVQQFMADSALSQLLIEATDRYCDRSGLSKDLIGPLFYTCWMHRALKEATRLSAARLERGHYVSLLRLCIDQCDAPALRRLFSLDR